MKLTVACHCGEVHAEIGEMQSRLTGGLAALHETLGLKLLSMVRMNFERETAPDGTPWTALRPATVRRRRGQAHPILRVEGNLYRSITVQADAVKAEVGSNWPYARIHQLGGEIQRKGGVARLHFEKVKSGPRKGKVRFSKADTASYGMKVDVKPYGIRIPARPYLYASDGGIPAGWLAALENIVNRHIGGGRAKPDRHS